ncbi:uncharacterized protein K460DRAFT_418124 [Cucurbitaria berberidis CBS 394.84]|uniref:Uncharacterized protein n=1 Tax=Cucurbitaria berberidis CBS 394.84 TaxID=1168544 RepID=A0A9P4GCZ6_9PLEO|nr:uncharacterized protein K460DRAFT_418124 [Cucurbitaria berberidis CBS 394.84]KAF1842979.1 hypothetical protein K460DRAFT_418124 [Cucurbitaria berberidis CBS 394.84]
MLISTAELNYNTHDYTTHHYTLYNYTPYNYTLYNYTLYNYTRRTTDIQLHTCKYTYTTSHLQLYTYHTTTQHTTTLHQNISASPNMISNSNTSHPTISPALGLTTPLMSRESAWSLRANSASLTHTTDKKPSAYQRVPNELIVMILYHALEMSKQRPITYRAFSCHIAPRGRLARFLTLNRTLYPMVLEAFYRTNKFLCNDRSDGYRPIPPYGVYLPPPAIRAQLRRLDITVKVSSWYFNADEVAEHHVRMTAGDKTALPYSALEKRVTCVRELRRSTGWKTLLELTDAEVGFARLEELKVKIETEIGVKYDGEFLDFVRQAGIVIKARKVVIEGGKKMLENLLKVDASEVEWINTPRLHWLSDFNARLTGV